MSGIINSITKIIEKIKMDNDLKKDENNYNKEAPQTCESEKVNERI